MHAGGIEIAQWKECESARQCEALETLVEVSCRKELGGDNSAQIGRC